MAKPLGNKKRSAKRGQSKRSTHKNQRGLKQNKWLFAFAALAIAALLYVTLSPQSAPPAPVFSSRVVAEFPHDTTAFTQGLLIEGGQLYESTGQYGKSLVRRVNLKTGQTEQAHTLEKSFFGEGLAALNGRLYQLTWKEKTCFVYDLNSLAPLDTLTIPTREGWGLTEDDQHLILSDGSEYLRYLDPETLEIVKEVEIRDQNGPVSKLNELEYIDGLVYANVWQNGRVAIIDPEKGMVVGWIDLNWLNVVHSPIDGADVLNGIAFEPNSRRLLITGKLWPTLYAMTLPSFDDK